MRAPPQLIRPRRMGLLAIGADEDLCVCDHTSGPRRGPLDGIGLDAAASIARHIFIVTHTSAAL